jgi:hypothetical protein
MLHESAPLRLDDARGLRSHGQPCRVEGFCRQKAACSPSADRPRVSATGALAARLIFVVRSSFVTGWELRQTRQLGVMVLSLGLGSFLWFPLGFLPPW